MEQYYFMLKRVTPSRSTIYVYWKVVSRAGSYVVILVRLYYYYYGGNRRNGITEIEPSLFGRGRTSITPRPLPRRMCTHTHTHYCAALARKPRGTNRMRSVGPEDAWGLVARTPDVKQYIHIVRPTTLLVCI